MHAEGWELKEPVFLKQKEVLLSLGILVQVNTTPSLGLPSRHIKKEFRSGARRIALKFLGK